MTVRNLMLPPLSRLRRFQCHRVGGRRPSRVPLRLGVRSRVREQRAAPTCGSVRRSGSRPVPHHRAGDRGRGASPIGAL